jgi:hypothetical protein
MNYYVMVCEGKYPSMPISRVPEVTGHWRVGIPIVTDITVPLVYTLDTDYGGTPKAMYYEKSIPVMRDDVVSILASAGVENIQYFSAVLRNPKTGQEYGDYKSYNVIGLVSAADMQASEQMGTSLSTIGDVDFHALVIDEEKACGLLLFRLAEATNALVVHQKIKDAIDSSGIPGFVFYGPGEWSG